MCVCVCVAGFSLATHRHTPGVLSREPSSQEVLYLPTAHVLTASPRASVSSSVKGGDSSLTDLPGLLGESEDPKAAEEQGTGVMDEVTAVDAFLSPDPKASSDLECWPHSIFQTSVDFPEDHSVATVVLDVGC